ncbi:MULTISPECIES: restriction endonuclease subunit S [Acinetobacter]|uniref:restriction endonuclease subunit S n=1 Tax=Acinetobacter TaxID=469 RepID=UPI00209ADAA3|nr:restriction endonuclease subunit S [Acinetobacter lwoffii]MCO8079529.1 restriction endonuclease subunit S [Acinetobacter lwoffii]
MNRNYSTLTSLLSKIVDNRGKSVPLADTGFPLIATNCIKHSSIYPTFENIRYINEETKANFFRAHPEPNDIIFVNKGTPGRVCLVPDPVNFCFAQDMMSFRCDPTKIDYQYLFAVLRSEYIQKTIENYHVGLVIPHFKKSDLVNLKIPRLKSRKEELLIGEFFLNVLKKIDTNVKIVSQLSEFLVCIYNFWFKQFNFPNENNKPYKALGGELVFNQTLNTMIPNKWEVKKIGDITKTCLGGTPNTKTDEYWSDGEIPWLSSAEVSNFPITSSLQKISKLGLENSAAQLLPKGTVVVSIVRYIRPSILALDAATNQSVVGIRENEDLKSSFLYPYFLSEVPRLMSLRTGAQQPHINKGIIDNSLIVVPPNSLLTKYYQIVDPMIEQINNLAFQNNLLQKSLDFIMPMLLNEQISFKEAEAHIVKILS